MAKKAKKRRDNNRQIDSTPQQQISNNGNKFVLFLAKFWQVIVGIGVVVGIVVAYPQFEGMWITPKEQVLKDNFYEGDLKPRKISESEVFSKGFEVSKNLKNDQSPIIKGVNIPNFKKYGLLTMLGETMYSVPNDFYKGAEILTPAFKGCTSSKLYIGVHEERLYVHVEFKDIQTEEIIGIIEYNHWRLYKKNVLSFNNDDERLEVRDKQNNIVFAIRYELPKDYKTPIVYISGYFISPYSVLVLKNNSINSRSQNCYPKSQSFWKENAVLEIEKIKSIF